MAQSVRAIMAVAIFMSYCLQFYVPMSIMWPLVKPRFETERGQKIAENVLRMILVLFTCEYCSWINYINMVISDVIFFF